MWLVIVGLAALLTCPERPEAAQDTRRHVLVVHSYHQGFLWTDEISRGIRTVLQKAELPVAVAFDYMDTKRQNSAAYRDILRQLYQVRYSQSKPDLVIAVDDNAFSFLLAHRQELFGDIPLLFCGTNFLDVSRLAGQRQITGVNETADMASTLRLALKLHPTTRQLYIIHDRTPTGLLLEKHLQSLLPELHQQVNVRLLSDLTMEELEAILRGVPQDSLVYFTLFFRDRNETFYEYDEGIERVVRASPVPVYIAWDFSLGSGAVGGYLTSGFNQGVNVGAMALQALQGTPISDIPLLLTSPSVPIFDWRVLRRFGIDEDQLPRESIFLNRPTTQVALSRETFYGLLATIIGGMLFTAGLVWVMLLRQRAQQALRQSETRLRALVENLPGGALYQDREVFFFNRGVERMIGYRREEIPDLDSWFTTLYRDRAARMRALWESEQRHGFSRVLRNLPMVRKDGQIRYCDYNIYHEGERTIGLLYDTTERKLTEDALRQSEQRHRILAESIPQCVFVKNAEGVYTFVNRRYLEVSGLNTSQVLGRTDYDLFPRELADLYRQGDIDILQNNQVIDQDEELQRSGERILIHVNKVALRDTQGRPVGILGVFWDVTAERKNAERLQQALQGAREAQKSIETIINTVSDAIIVTHADGRVRSLNQAARRKFALEPARGISDSPILCQKDLETYLQRAVAQRDINLTQDIIMPGDTPGARQVYQAKTSYLYQDDGSISGAVTVLRDVTRERDLERMKNEFISNAAHELRTPLTSIMGFSELLLSTEFSDEQREDFLNEIHDNGTLLDRLINDLLDLSRMETGRPLPIHRTPCNLRDTLERVMHRYQLHYPKRNFTLRLLAEPVTDVLADPDRIQQVLDNLLSNAVKYAPNSPVLLEEQLNPQGYQICVTDQGPGMTPTQVERIFERFYRCEPQKDVAGLGLGMSIVKAIADAHEGTINIITHPGQGTRVCLWLPRDQAAQQQTGG